MAAQAVDTVVGAGDNSLNEFELIRQYFQDVGPKGPDFVLGVGDDCAVLSVPQGAVLCCSLDTMVAGVHFPAFADPADIAGRALRAAVSDLAAMGATPAHFTLSLTLPEARKNWLEAFASGLSQAADTLGLRLIGGDTTRGPLNIAIQVGGYARLEQLLRRDGALPGDVLLVSGTLGDAGAALSFLDRPKQELNTFQRYLLERYYAPTPRVELAALVSGMATSAIDISDGLLADARHIATASGVALHIELERLPLSQALRQYPSHESLQFACSAGDDYELLLSMPESVWLAMQSSVVASQLTQIGWVASGSGVHTYRAGDLTEVPHTNGYQHFV